MVYRKRITKRMKKSVFDKHGNKCFYCGIDLNEDLLQFDHVHPFSKGGEDTIENLVPSCYLCNSYKNDKTLDEFREALLIFKEKHKGDLEGVTYHMRIANNYNILKEGFSGKFYFEL